MISSVQNRSDVEDEAGSTIVTCGGCDAAASAWPIVGLLQNGQLRWTLLLSIG
jgi:hypothetical protein